MSRLVSVIINTYQRGESLALTLRALEQLDYPDFEVVVVNGPSTDHTMDVLDSYRDRVVVARCLERNLSRSRNIGVREAAGEIVAFIDDDAYPDPAWLDRIVEAYDDPEVAAAGGPVYNYTGSDIQTWRSFVDRFGNARVEHEPKRHPRWAASTPFAAWVPYTIGTNSSFRRELLVSMGGFDETFEYYLEESDLCCRLLRRGYVVAQLDDGFVYHKFLPSWVRDRPDVVKDYRQVLTSKAYFALRHGLEVGSFAEVCRDISVFFGQCADEVEAAVTNGLLTPDDRAKFERDAALASDAALAAWVGPPATRPPEWFEREARDVTRFGVRHPHGDRLHLCLLSQEYPPVRVNGIGRVVHSLAVGLAEAGHVVHVVTRGEIYRRVDLEEGVWVHRVPVLPHPPPAGIAVPPHVWDYAASVRDEVRLIDEHRPLDLVQAPNWDSEAIALLEEDALPVVVALYTPLKTLTSVDPLFARALADPDDPTLRQMVDLERLGYERAAALLACGPSVVDEIETQYGIELDPARIGFVAHGLADLSGGADAQRPPADSLELLFVGRLEARKGADLLLAAVPGLLRRHPQLSVTIAGDDALPTDDGRTLRQRFEAGAEAGDLARVEFVGPPDDARLLELYARCAVLVVPSRYESFGLMLLEAMMFGKPVVAAAVGGMRDVVVDGETGVLVAAEDAAALEAGIERLLEDPELRSRMGAAGRARFVEYYARSAMVDGVVTFYRQLLGEGRRRRTLVSAAGGGR